MSSYKLENTAYERLHRQVLQAESVLNLLITDGNSIDGFESSHSIVMGAIDNTVELIERIKKELEKLNLKEGKHHG